MTFAKKIDIEDGGLVEEAEEIIGSYGLSWALNV